ncbi:MAG: hypothetical protein ACFFD4_38840, partial [Candidatus Odinarchaeota archaeon]
FSKKIDTFLREGLSGIYLKDERFGNVDDVVFEINDNTLCCYQVKESERDSQITLGFFTSAEESGKSLLERFFESYQQIKGNFPNYQITIICTTNKSPSGTRQYTPRDNDNNRQIPLSQFIQEVWKPFKAGNLSQEAIMFDSLYRLWIEKFAESMNKSLNETWEFLEHFDIEFDVDLRRDMTNYEFLRYKESHDWFILNKTDPSRKGFISVLVLRKELGLSANTNRHQFPVDKMEYVAREGEFNAIKRLLSEMEKGYILLKGSPSTGKSTFLQSEINTKNLPECVIFRYLCYHSPSEFISRSRGELNHFYEDLNEQFYRFLRIDFSERDQGIKFHQYLTQLSAYAEESSRKIVIVI